MKKYQLTVQDGDDSLSSEDIQQFVDKVGQENVQVLVAPEIIEFWSPPPILRINIEHSRRSFFGDDAVFQLKAL